MQRWKMKQGSVTQTVVDRTVKVVYEDKKRAPVEPPVIDNIVMLEKTVTPGASTDPFEKDAGDYSQYQGLSKGFKASNTRSFNKFQRGLDGAESQQIHEKEWLTGYDTFEVVEPPHNLEHLAKIYELPSASAHYAAVNAKVANIVGLGYRLVETPKTKRALEAAQESGEGKSKKLRRKLDEQREDLLDYLEKMNEEDSFTEILTKVWRDYEVTGNGYIEISRKKDGEIGYIGHIPATTMRIRRRRDGFVQLSGFDAQFFAHYGAGIDSDTGEVKAIPNPINPGQKTNEVIHFKKYSPNSGYYGVPDIIAAQSAIAGNEFASRYNLDYFENKAVPRYAIILKGATLTPNAEASLLSFFEASLKGQNHRSIYIPLPGDTPEQKVELKLEAIEAGIQDSSFNNYRKANLSDILMAHRVPISKVSTGDGGSLAIARDADKTFKEQVCGPEQKIAEKKLTGPIRELTDSFDIKLNEMTLTDEDTQSKIDERGVKNGWLLPNEVRANKGMSGIPGGNERVDPNAKAKQDAANADATRERDATRSANATDSAGESRNPKGEGRTTQ